MKITVQGYITARKYSWEGKVTYSWTSVDPALWPTDYIMVAPHELTLEIPDDFDFNAYKVAAITRKKADVQRELTTELARLEKELAAMSKAHTT